MAEMKATMLPPSPGLFPGRWTGTTVSWMETEGRRVMWASVEREAPGPGTRVLVEVEHESLETFPPQTRVNIAVMQTPTDPKGSDER